MELLTNGIGKDLTTDLNTSANRNTLECILNNFKVGKYAPNISDEKVN